MVLCIKKNERILKISLDIWPTMHPLLEVTVADHLQHIQCVCYSIFPHNALAAFITK